MQFLQFGSLTIPTEWLLTLISLLGGWLYIKMYRRVLFGLEDSVDTVINGFFVWGFVWKFSIIIFDFSAVRHHLTTIIYFSGGTKGFYLGMMMASLYLLWIAKNKKRWRPLSIVILLWGTVSYGLYILLNGFIQQEGLLTLIAYASVLVIFSISLWEKDIEETLQTKAAIILIVWGMIFQIPKESLSFMLLPLLFPLLSIVLHIMAMNEEKI